MEHCEKHIKDNIICLMSVVFFAMTPKEIEDRRREIARNTFEKFPLYCINHHHNEFVKIENEKSQHFNFISDENDVLNEMKANNIYDFQNIENFCCQKVYTYANSRPVCEVEIIVKEKDRFNKDKYNLVRKVHKQNMYELLEKHGFWLENKPEQFPLPYSVYSLHYSYRFAGMHDFNINAIDIKNSIDIDINKEYIPYFKIITEVVETNNLLVFCLFNHPNYKFSFKTNDDYT